MTNTTSGPGGASTRAFALTLGSSRPNEFEVVSVRGREGMNRLYHFDVSYVAKTFTAVEAGLGAPARLELPSPEAARFGYRGVSRVESLRDAHARPPPL